MRAQSENPTERKNRQTMILIAPLSDVKINANETEKGGGEACLLARRDLLHTC